MQRAHTPLGSSQPAAQSAATVQVTSLPQSSPAMTIAAQGQHDEHSRYNLTCNSSDERGKTHGNHENLHMGGSSEGGLVYKTEPAAWGTGCPVLLTDALVSRSAAAGLADDAAVAKTAASAAVLDATAHAGDGGACSLAVFTHFDTVKLGLRNYPTRRFCSSNGYYKLCLRDVLIAAGRSCSTLTIMKCKLEQQHQQQLLHEGGSSPSESVMQRQKHGGKGPLLDVASIGYSIKMLEASVSESAAGREKEEALAVVDTLRTLNRTPVGILFVFFLCKSSCDRHCMVSLVAVSTLMRLYHLKTTDVANIMRFCVANVSFCCKLGKPSETVKFAF